MEAFHPQDLNLLRRFPKSKRHSIASGVARNATFLNTHLTGGGGGGGEELFIAPPAFLP